MPAGTLSRADRQPNAGSRRLYRDRSLWPYCRSRWRGQICRRMLAAGPGSHLSSGKRCAANPEHIPYGLSKSGRGLQPALHLLHYSETAGQKKKPAAAGGDCRSPGFAWERRKRAGARGPGYNFIRHRSQADGITEQAGWKPGRPARRPCWRQRPWACLDQSPLRASGKHRWCLYQNRCIPPQCMFIFRHSDSACQQLDSEKNGPHVQKRWPWAPFW